MEKRSWDKNFSDLKHKSEFDHGGVQGIEYMKKPIKTTPTETAFAEIVSLIKTARRQAFQAINTTLIELYWQVGAYISRKIEGAEGGDGVVEQLASYIARTQPGLRGFTRPNLFRMRQFYETHHNDVKISALLRLPRWWGTPSVVHSHRP